MNKSTLTFDIETVPQRAPLSAIQKAELDKKVKRQLSSNDDMNEEEATKLIMGTSPFFGEIICIGVKINNDSFTLVHDNEQVILSDWWKVLEDFRGLFISYNGISFDSPFILLRSSKFGYLPTNRKFLTLYQYQADTHFDVYNIAKMNNFRGGVSLRLLCDHLGVPSPKEEEIKAENVAEAYAEGRIDEIAQYCLRDVKATFQCYEIMKNYTSYKL